MSTKNSKNKVTKHNKKYKFIDAQKIHEEHPDTFHIPSEDEIKNIRVGDLVKISNGRERFWVEIAQTADKTNCLLGIVRNKLLEDFGYDFGDQIHFHTKNIFTITKKQDAEYVDEEELQVKSTKSNS